MKRINEKSVFCLVLFSVFLLWVLMGTAFCADPAAKGGTPLANQQNKSNQRFVSIDFNNVDISVFVKFISELTGKNFIIDQRIKGKVTIISPAKISVAEAYRVFESVLEVHGFSTVDSGKVIKIVPSAAARSKSIETRLKEEYGPVADKIVTQLIPLTYADPVEIKRLFTPLVSKSSVVLAYTPTNTLIITDVMSNIKRLMRILKTIDIPGVGKGITIIPIEYAEAPKLVTLLGSIFKPTRATMKKGAGAATPTTIVSDERTNTIVMVASDDDTARIKSLVSVLDVETPRGKEKIHVYYLEHASAEEMVKVLMELPQKQTTAAKGKKSAPVVSEKVRVTADKATNSLIIMADSEDYVTLEKIIKKIDIPRAMVYIESLIMEVNVNKNFELGTEWTVGGKTTVDNHQTVIGGGYKSDSALTTYSGTVPVLPSGLSLGMFGESLTIAGVTFPSVSAVVNAYKKDKDVHILSTPQIMTMENETAKIYVGKNVPYQTKSTTTDNDTYNSFEYKDVGKTLEITPQISKDRMVRLNIALETTSLESTTDNRPTTLKRTVDTTVIVKDNHTVVIGGLIDDSVSATDYKIPCLGDIPGFGMLFNSKARDNEKTNLFIFLTPRVIQNINEADAVYKSKKEKISQIKEKQIKLYNSSKFADNLPENPTEEEPVDKNNPVPETDADSSDPVNNN